MLGDGRQTVLGTDYHCDVSLPSLALRTTDALAGVTQRFNGRFDSPARFRPNAVTAI